VQQEISQLGIQLERSEAARRGYLLTDNPQYRSLWQESATAAATEVAQLTRDVSDNETQRLRAEQLSRDIEALRRLQEESIAAIDRDGRQAVQSNFATDQSAPALRNIREHRRVMADEESRLLAERNDERIEARGRFYAILAACAVLVLAIILASILVIRRYTRELASSRDLLHRLNIDLEGVVTERTVELRRSNDEIQRFAYIVSHDLRSPLVNVMGFTAELETARQPLLKLVAEVEARAPELATHEAKVAVEEDLPEAVRFIRASTDKMDRLINAILKLSRQGRRTLAPEPLDMSQLVQASADGLKQLADTAGAEIEIGTLPNLVSDRVTIDQIFSNLIENAVKYLSPARPGRIKVTGRAETGRMVFDIVDNGRGIDPRDHERIFDLFRRSGMQDQPGEGIGLAHVRSQVWRLGGTIEVHSALDEGATFRLSLPERISGEVTP